MYPNFGNFAAEYMNKFKTYSWLSRMIISGTFIAASTTIYLISSYYINKLTYPQLPKIYYSIHGDINNNQGILIFFSGWPDIECIYDPQIEYFVNKNYCCICMELPNMNVYRLQNPWGYKLYDIVKSMGITLRNILNTSNVQKDKVILCGHDWGSYIAQLIYVYNKTQIKFDKLILLDVADGSNRKTNPAKVYTYQYINCLAFLLPRFIGTWILRRYYNNLLKINNITLPIIRLEKEHNKTYFDSAQGYVYFHILMHKNLKQMDELKKINMKSKLNELDGLPILFIDATKGWHYKVDYYSETFKKWINERNYCKFIEFDCYHWIQDTDIGLPQKLNDCIHEWIK